MSYAIQHGNWYSHERFTWVFLGFLLLSIGNMLFKKEDDSSPVNTENTSTLSRLLVGFFAGTVVSLSGLGGGIVMVPLFRMILKLPVKKATALSLSVVPLLSVFPIMQYLSISDAPLLSNAVLPTLNTMKLFQTQYLVGLFYIPMALGVVVFSSFGQKTALKTPTPIIRFIFALLSGIILIKTLYELF
jgi:uncharacterized membrane protein YfcA